MVAFWGIVGFGIGFAAFCGGVGLVFGFVVGPFTVLVRALQHCAQLVLCILVSPVVWVEGSCRVVGGVSRGIPFVAPVLVTVPHML